MNQKNLLKVYSLYLCLETELVKVISVIAIKCNKQNISVTETLTSGDYFVWFCALIFVFNQKIWWP